jgi:UDP-N-acetylmuramate--alanine ligase
VITYGFSPQADVRALDVHAVGGAMRFNVEIVGRDQDDGQRIDGFTLPMLGEHNVLNALAAIAVAHEMGIPDDKSRAGLARFGGVKRRFTKTGEARGVTVFDDYGHHPVEIAAVLKAARQATGGKVIAIVQPHRYTRLAALFEEFCTCFNDADHVIVAEVFAAGEEPIESADRDALVGGMRARGHRDVTALTDVGLLAPLVSELAQPGDLVVCLGAGNITAWANALPGELEEVYAAKDAQTAQATGAG